MLERRLDDTGTAYDWFMLVFLLIFGVVLWMVTAYALNLAMDPVNDRIADGQMSAQTKGPIDFGMAVFAAVPVFLIIGALIWAILAGTNKGNT